MAYQAFFKRYEIKYLLSVAQKQQLIQIMASHMALDQYGRATIRNLYFDTPSYRLIRRSMEKPVYKEKLRLRSYHPADGNTPIYVELKKKYKSVVYKRRLSLPEKEAMAWMAGEIPRAADSQIGREIDYFLQFYHPLRPAVYLSYQREAYYSLDGSDFRVTFDDHILCREDHLSLQKEPGGLSLLPDDRVLMEIKTAGGIPLWMTQALTREKITKTSFSKYGTAYQHIILPRCKGGIFHD